MAGGLCLVEAGGGGGVGGGGDDIRVGLGLPGDGFHRVDEGVEGAFALALCGFDHEGLGDDLGEVHGGRVEAVVHEALGNVQGPHAVSLLL